MTLPSRAAERNKFTQQRATLMFAGYVDAKRRLDLPWSATVHEGTDPLAGELPAPLRRQPGAADSAGDE